jgi:hypothetical protein
VGLAELLDAAVSKLSGAAVRARGLARRAGLDDEQLRLLLVTEIERRREHDRRRADDGADFQLRA